MRTIERGEGEGGRGRKGQEPERGVREKGEERVGEIEEILVIAWFFNRKC